MSDRLAVGLNAVIVAVTEDEPRVLTVDREGTPALPWGLLDPELHPTLELGLRDWVEEQSGLELGYAEQLYTFGDRDRVPGGRHRQLSIVYLALVREGALLAADWRPIYDFLPWEDWRGGEPGMLRHRVLPALRQWMARVGRTASRRERCDLAFGLSGAPWDGERVLKRYELLYEAGLADRMHPEPDDGSLGEAMFIDHRRMLATALGRLRGKIRYRPVIFELLPELFTLLQLQRVAEALAGRQLHKQNFRRLVTQGGLVEGTGDRDHGTGGRPAELFRFRSTVVRERPSPGVGLPRLASSGSS